MADLNINCIISTKSKTYLTYISNLTDETDLNDTIRCQDFLCEIKKKNKEGSISVGADSIPIVALANDFKGDEYAYEVYYWDEKLVDGYNALYISNVKEIATLSEKVQEEYAKYFTKS